MVMKSISGMRKIGLLVLVDTLLVGLLLFFSTTFGVFAIVGEDNVTVITNLTVGNTYPEVLNVSIENDAASFDLTPNATTTLTCTARVRDFNGDTDLNAVNATFYNSNAVTLADPDDKNNKYTNGSCPIILAGEWGGHADDAYTAVANCTYEIEYYADAADWNCTVFVNDSLSWEETGTDEITVNTLLALGLPDIIQYGTVNATEVSDENVTNVTNFGNVPMNLSVEGYAQTEGDGLAMNCTLGNIGTIPVYWEKYNFTNINPGVLTLSQFEGVYANLTSDAVVRQYELAQRQNDGFNEASNYTYWRIYVPRGVAGTCQGKIIFGATQAPGAAYT